MKIAYLAPLLLFVFPHVAQSQENKPAPIEPAFKDSPVVSSEATVKLLSAEYKFTEGPAVDSQGNVYFTDQPNDQIVKWSTDGTLSTFLKPAGRANGLWITRKGALLACADEKNELWSIDLATKKPTVLLKEHDGKLLNGPNDVWEAPDGGIYFTDPFYKRKYWKRGEREQDGQHVYYIAPGSKTAIRVVNDLKQPNGIVGTPDGKTLYIADIGDKKTFKYTIKDDGTLSRKYLIIEMGSDGMTLDDEEHLYLTGKGVTVVSTKNREIIERIPIDEGWTANVCFGGADNKTLFITAMDSLYSLEMKVSGQAGK